MASDNPTAGGSSRRSRTPPTLDLKAEEVRADTPSEAVAETPADGESVAAEAVPAGVEPPAKEPSGDTTSVADAAPAEVSADNVKAEAPEGDDAPQAKPDASESADKPAAQEPQPQPEAPRRGGAGTVFAALVLGALAGGAAGGGVFYYLMQNAPRPAAVDLSPLTARIAALEARPAADPEALASLRQSLSRADARFTALDSALAVVKAAPASSSAVATPAPNVDALKAALGKTEAAVADVSGRVTALKASQDNLKTAQDTLQSAVAAATSTAQQAQGQAQGLAPRLEGINTRIDTVRKEAADAANAAASVNRGAASVLVLGTLKQSVDAGRPFTQELEAARALLGPRAAPLEPFASMAQTGFPPLPQLADQLLAAGNAAIDGLTPAPEAPAADASLVTRFLASAQSLVKVRPADGIDPDSLRGLLNRAVAAVRMGDIESALATLKQLPQPAQQKLAPVVAELDARRRAAEAAATLYQQALAAISGKAP